MLVSFLDMATSPAPHTIARSAELSFVLRTASRRMRDMKFARADDDMQVCIAKGDMAGAAYIALVVLKRHDAQGSVKEIRFLESLFGDDADEDDGDDE